MELYDEEVNQKKSKMPMIIGICIAVLVFITGLIVWGIIYLKSSITTIQINGVINNNIEELLYIESTEEGEQQLYIPIIKIAQFLGYEGFTGDYKEKSEDKTKCHVTSSNEIAMFTQDSDVLIKIVKDSEYSASSEYEYIKLDKAVFEKDGELYTTIDGIQKAFNVAFSCDAKLKDIKIYTMDYLMKYYTTRLNIKEYATDFIDQKSIFENMIIIKEDEKKYGVINAQTGDYILEAKYESIKYLPATTDFLVKSNGKYGVVSKEATSKIKTVYDSIITMDSQKGLYLVKQNNTYGVVNTDGKVIIEPEYKQIGINIDDYSQNGLENSYILLDEVIPIKNDQDKWGFFNIQGESITDFKYTSVGCKLTPASNSYPALIIQSHKAIVVQKEQYYNIISIEGEELIPVDVDSVYLKSNAETEQNKFFMTSNDNTKVKNVEEWLTSIGK